MITYQSEKFEDHYQEAFSLIKAHWAEMGEFPGMDLDIAKDSYINTERAGALLAVTVRVDGVMQGYILSIVGPSIFAAGSIQAFQIANYITQKYRGAWNGLRIFWEREAFARGAKLLIACQKIKDDTPIAPDKLFESAGYERGEVSWYKFKEKTETP